MRIEVQNNDLARAMRVLKSKLRREGVLREMRERRYHEKPSEERRRKAEEAQRRARKYRRAAAKAEEGAGFAPHHNPGSWMTRRG